MEGFFTNQYHGWIAIGVGVIALLFAFYLSARVKKEQVNNAKMEEIAGAIHEGAMAFLAREYKVLVIVIWPWPHCLSLQVLLRATVRKP